MRIDEKGARLARSRQVDLEDTVARDRIDEFPCVEIVVVRRNEDVVDVEENSTVGPDRDLRQEFPLRHLVLAKRQIARHVLDCDSPTKPILDTLDAFDHVSNDRLRVGKWQEVVDGFAVDTRPAEMIGQPRGLETSGQRCESFEVRLVEGIGRAEIQRDAVKRDGKSRTHGVEHANRPTAGNHVVLADGLEPIDSEAVSRGLGEDLCIVLRAQTDTHTDELRFREWTRRSQGHG